MTPSGNYRFSILRFYWDGEATPSAEVLIGDFFARAYTSFNTVRPIDSLPICVNPALICSADPFIGSNLPRPSGPNPESGVSNRV